MSGLAGGGGARSEVRDVYSASSVAVSTTTPLTAWIALRPYAMACLGAKNLDGEDDLYIGLQFSMDGVAQDSNNPDELIASPGQWAHFEIGPTCQNYVRLVAHTVSPTFPSILVDVMVHGLTR
jgi:hypothetical protein